MTPGGGCGRQQHACDLPYLPVAQVEQEVARHYATVRLSEDFRAFMTGKIDAALADSTATRNQVRRQLTKRLKELAAQEDHYFDLVGNPDWPQAKLSERMRKIAEERAGLQAQLDAAEVDLSTGREVLTELCELLANPRELYQQASRRARRSLNKAIFSRLYLDGDEVSKVVVSGEELNEGVAPIVRAERQGQALVGTRWESQTVTLFGETYETGALTGEDAVFNEVTLAGLVDLACGSGCSSREHMVGRTTHYPNHSPCVRGPVVSSARRQ